MRWCLLLAGFSVLASSSWVWGQEGDAGIQSDELSRYASGSSVQTFLSRFPSAAYLTFPEPRERPIQTLNGLPEAWVQRAPATLTTFEGDAQPGEYYVFQIGVFAARQTVENLEIRFSDLIGGTTIPGPALTPFDQPRNAS